MTASNAVTKSSPGPGRRQHTPLSDHVEHILSLIRPAIKADGGDVELVDVSTDGVVRVRFHGACVGCPSSSVTLQVGIERNLKQYVPQVTSVLSVI